MSVCSTKHVHGVLGEFNSLKLKPFGERAVLSDVSYANQRLIVTPHLPIYERKNVRKLLKTCITFITDY